MNEKLYDRIGRSYDATRRADPFLADQFFRHLNLKAGEALLDVACGTGNYALALAKRGLKVTGVDIAVTMLREARRKGPSIEWIEADAARLPFDKGQFRAASCMLALHHFSRLDDVMSEVHRVTRGGPFVIFSSLPEQTEAYWLREYFPSMITSSAQCLPSKERIYAALNKAGYEEIHYFPYLVRDDLQDFFLYAGKERPRLYLDAEVRAGISSFSALAHADEVEAGLQRLEQDIASGAINAVRRSCASEAGDYVFIVAR